jgi:lysophospholipase L1-like esterase
MIGINNAPTHTAEEITEAIGIVVRRVLTKASSATIILLSPLPPGEGPTDPVRVKMDTVTNGIKRFADGKKVLFYDIRDQFLVDGGLPDNGSLSKDHIHLTRDGYAVWAEILDEILDSNGF